MGFWEEFGMAYSKIWAIVETPMHFGGITFSFADVLLTTVLIGIICKMVQRIIYDER